MRNLRDSADATIEVQTALTIRDTDFWNNRFATVLDYKDPILKHSAQLADDQLFVTDPHTIADNFDTTKSKELENSCQMFCRYRMELPVDLFIELEAQLKVCILACFESGLPRGVQGAAQVRAALRSLVTEACLAYSVDADLDDW